MRTRRGTSQQKKEEYSRNSMAQQCPSKTRKKRKKKEKIGERTKDLGQRAGRKNVNHASSLFCFGLVVFLLDGARVVLRYMFNVMLPPKR